MYADDLALMATSPEELQALLHETQLWAEENFAVINTDKSHVMVFMENEIDRQSRHSTQNKLYIRHESDIPAPLSTLQEVRTFKYLGLQLDSQLTYDSAIKHTTKAFWYAHSQTRLLDMMHAHGLPRDIPGINSFSGNSSSGQQQIPLCLLCNFA